MISAHMISSFPNIFFLFPLCLFFSSKDQNLSFILGQDNQVCLHLCILIKDQIADLSRPFGLVSSFFLYLSLILFCAWRKERQLDIGQVMQLGIYGGRCAIDQPGLHQPPPPSVSRCFLNTKKGNQTIEEECFPV